eukprot:6181567-Pleurochrysis_carterae.AAC.1
MSQSGNCELPASVQRGGAGRQGMRERGRGSSHHRSVRSHRIRSQSGCRRSLGCRCGDAVRMRHNSIKHENDVIIVSSLNRDLTSLSASGRGWISRAIWRRPLILTPEIVLTKCCHALPQIARTELRSNIATHMRSIDGYFRCIPYDFIAACDGGAALKLALECSEGGGGALSGDGTTRPRRDAEFVTALL